MGVLATALGILTISGYVRLWHVYVFAFVFGAAAALDAPVRQTFVGELVGDEHLSNADARGFGLLSSIMAIGTMSGAFLAAGRDKPKFGSLLLGSGVFGIGCTLAAFSPGYWWFAAALAVIGVAALTFTTATNSMMQLSTEPTMRGRVMAIRVGVALGGTAIGAPIVGWVANHFGPRWSLGIAAISAFLAALVAALMMAKPVAAALDT
jgi:MFS family permease